MCDINSDYTPSDFLERVWFLLNSVINKALNLWATWTFAIVSSAQINMYIFMNF